MNSFSAPSAWSRRDVERFCDGDLPADVAGRLGDQARTDPALSARLADVRRFDSELRHALLAPPVVREACRSSAAWRWTMGAAACVAVICIAALWLRPAPVPTAPIVRPGPGLALEAAIEPAPFRVVWERPARRAAPREPDAPEAPGPLTGVPSAAALPGDLDAALRRGDTRAAAEALAEAEGPLRDRMLRRLGEIIHSAGSAQRVLDGLSVEQQLEACRLWAREPGLQNIVFARLARLAGDERTRPAAATVVGALAGDAELLPWLRRYGLAGGGAS